MAMKPRGTGHSLVEFDPDGLKIVSGLPTGFLSFLLEAVVFLIMKHLRLAEGKRDERDRV